ncbi:flagellar filament capping protein FliD [Caballeronia sp. LjRoot34]|uniref:flagellar filament capping protein FliD n=1 Tax=Caballeronia sp. LjRoot34 TaxID=3342325 RepID=UPI003ECF4873
MSTIPSASSSAGSAAATAAATAAASAAAEAAAAQSIISGSTGNSSLDVSSLVTSLVNAKVAGQTGTLSAQQTNDNTQLSAIGALQAALGALQAGIASLSNGSALGQFTATADGTGLTATADTTASAGSYSVAVTQIASAQTLSSAAFGSTTALGTGTMNISVGGKSMSVAITSTDNTVSGIASAINSSANNPGVTATVVTGTDGAHLVLRSTATGASNTINVAVTGVAGDAGLSSLGVTSTPGTSGAASTFTSAVNTSAGAWTQTASAQDAAFSIDGTAATSSSNTVTTALQGVTLNLTAAAIGTPPGTPQTLTVAQNTSSASTAINSFVSLYNTLVTTYGQVGNDNSAAASTQGGALATNPMLTTIQNTLAGIIDSGVPNGNSTISLGAIGITLQGQATATQPAGSLVIDSTKLAAALQSNPSGVAALFNQTTGVAAQMTTSLNSFLATGGLISNSQAAVNTDLASIATQQTTLTAYTAQLTSQYQAQFTALNTLMATMNNNSQYLTQLFGGADSAGALASANNS